MFKLGLTFLMGAAVVVASAGPASAQPRQRNSPHETISAFTNGGLVTIVYGRPHAKNRQIWGKLLPYGKPWRTGADECTLLCTTLPLEIDGKTIPAGAYTLYTIPEDEKPTKLVISKQIGGWGLPKNKDLAQFDMKKEMLDKPVEQFTIDIEKTKTGGVLKLMWEKREFSVPFTVLKK